MLKELASYSCVIAKTRAKYGKMLSREDWERLREMKSVREILIFLRGHAGWAGALPPSGAAEPDPASLAALFRSRLFAEYESIFPYVSQQDKKLLLYMLCKEEYRQILAALRRLISGSGSGRGELLPEFLLRKSKIDLVALRAADSYGAVRDAVRGGIFHKALRTAPVSPETGLPDYKAVSILLENCYYSSVYSFLKRRFRGVGALPLAGGVGFEADLLNISSILRLHRHFRGSLPGAGALLAPVHRRLNPRLRAELTQAPSELAAAGILANSPWGKYFDGYEASTLESRYRQALEDFNKKQLRNSGSCLGPAVAYLNLLELEVQRLVRLVEALRCGISSDKAI